MESVGSLRKRFLVSLATFVSLWANQPVLAATETGSVNAGSAHRPRVILALGGGGTRGAAHVGVLRVLRRENIPIDGIVGTSMGAIVGGLYCAGLDPDQIEQQLLDKKMLRAYNTVPIPLRVAAIPICLIPHLFGYRPYDGLYRGSKFRNYLNNSVAASDRDIQDLKIPFAAVASNLVDGTALTIDKGNLGLALQASSAIPFLRRAVPVGESALCVDGAIEANLPVDQARAMGADIVIAVDVDEEYSHPDPRRSFRHILTVPSRVTSLLLTKLDEDAVKRADVLIHPDVNGIHLLSEKYSDGVRAIAAGEKATEEAMPAIRARLAQTASRSENQ
ncbi:MAG TPA: patatin-like phospholipase family protein [Planktothrix sp.]|jgi:NTE family protein